LRSFELEQKAERFQQLLKLPEALSSLADADRYLIESLYFKGMSTRECASLSGISQRALIKRRDRILNVLKKIYKNF
jgi:Sigma-70, region 4.